MSDKKIRCVVCRSEFTREETEGVNACPSCGNTGVPMSIEQDVSIDINWHELRILTIWASNYARSIKDNCRADNDPVECVNAIIRELEKHRQSDWAPLTIMGEVRELAQALDAKVEVHGPGVHEVVRPKPKN